MQSSGSHRASGVFNIIDGSSSPKQDSPLSRDRRASKDKKASIKAAVNSLADSNSGIEKDVEKSGSGTDHDDDSASEDSSSSSVHVEAQ